MKKFLCLLLSIVVLGWGGFAQAQQAKKMPRIGIVGSGEARRELEAFRQGLRDLGYIEGKNILVEYGYLEGKLDLTPGLVAELVQLKVDVLILITLHSALCTLQSILIRAHHVIQ